jgi:hypothetical protein
MTQRLDPTSSSRQLRPDRQPIPFLSICQDLFSLSGVGVTLITKDPLGAFLTRRDNLEPEDRETAR